jgi:hypothetical protein
VASFRGAGPAIYADGVRPPFAAKFPRAVRFGPALPRKCGVRYRAGEFRIPSKTRLHFTHSPAKDQSSLDCPRILMYNKHVAQSSVKTCGFSNGRYGPADRNFTGDLQLRLARATPFREKVCARIGALDLHFAGAGQPDGRPSQGFGKHPGSIGT